MGPSELLEILFASANAAASFALTCLEPAGRNLRARSSFVDPDGRAMHWHDFGDLEGPGWAANAIGGGHLLYRWGAFLGDGSIQQKALRLLDHVLEDGFVRPDGFIWPYWDLAQRRFCANYVHGDSWLCPGSLAKVGVQMLDWAADLGAEPRAVRLREAAQGLGGWLADHVPLLGSGWAPRRITLAGEPYPLTPEGVPDPIFDHSADGLFMLEFCALLGKRDLALELGSAFLSAGGFWGSINHDTYDDHENVAYAVAFRVLRRAADLLEEPGWRRFAYDVALPAMRRFRMETDRHGVRTGGLFWMEESWDTAYLWENAEVAQAYLEARTERNDPAWRDVAAATLSAIAHHHYGPLGFLSEGVDWNNHVSQRHHVHGDHFGAIRYTEPLLNNLHLIGPTLAYLRAAGFDPPAALVDAASSIRRVRALSAADRRALADCQEGGARYLLRLFYPLLETDESVESVLAFIGQAGIDGVLLFESNYDTDPALLTLDVLQERFARLKEIAPRFRQAGLAVHINVEITMGHVDAGGARPERFGFQFQVDEQGNVSRSSACSLDPAFLAYVGQIYRWAAECGADAVWVDDDVRFLRHDVPGMTCFCPLHLAAMSERTGRGAPWAREELVAALRDDTRAALRQAWFDLQEEAMLALAERVEREVHAVDAEQRIGLMSVGTAFHSAEGRHTDRLLRVLAGEHVQPMLRPGSGFWHDREPGGVLIKTEEVARQTTFLGRDVRTVAEIENHPYSPFQKSRRVLALELALEVLAGTDDLSLNILNSTTPFSRGDLDHATFLRAQRPFLDALVLARAGKLRLGIGVEASEDVARRMRLQGRALSSWVEPRPWEIALGRLGFPVGQPCSAPHLIDGDAAYAMDRYAIESALHDGAVFTPGAIRALLSLGWGERLGIREVRPAAAGVNEFFTEDPLNQGHCGARLQVRHYAGTLGPHTFEFGQGRAVRVLSRWVDVDSAERGPAALAIELEDGARLGVLPFEVSVVSPALLRSERREQWAALFEWVGRRPLPCRVLGGVNVYPQLWLDPGSAQEDRLLVVANLSADDVLAHVQVAAHACAAGATRSAKRLTAAGAWTSGAGLASGADPTGGGSLFEITVPAWSLVALRL
jgi:hypothetical protein